MTLARSLTTESLLEVNARANRLQGIGSWRALYREFLTRLPVASVLEIGSGDPAFLASLPQGIRRLAIDGNPALAPLYAAAGIELHVLDLDREDLPASLDDVDAVVCSDVFEHLLHPERVLDRIAAVLRHGGVLFSHVPNEFRLRQMSRILLGLGGSVVFHPECEEWNNPHLRRFTDAGYRRFLSLRFRHELKLNDLSWSRFPRWLDRMGLGVPYCFEGGPTYASTNDEASLRRLADVKEELRRSRKART